MISHWDSLEIEPTKDLKKIKKAYAYQLKRTRIKESTEQFQELKTAFDYAVSYATTSQEETRDCYDNKFKPHEKSINSIFELHLEKKLNAPIMFDDLDEELVGYENSTAYEEEEVEKLTISHLNNDLNTLMQDQEKRQNLSCWENLVSTHQFCSFEETHTYQTQIVLFLLNAYLFLPQAVIFYLMESYQFSDLIDDPKTLLSEEWISQLKFIKNKPDFHLLESNYPNEELKKYYLLRYQAYDYLKRENYKRAEHCLLEVALKFQEEVDFRLLNVIYKIKKADYSQESLKIVELIISEILTIDSKNPTAKIYQQFITYRTTKKVQIDNSIFDLFPISFVLDEPFIKGLFYYELADYEAAYDQLILATDEQLAPVKKVIIRTISRQLIQTERLVLQSKSSSETNKYNEQLRIIRLQEKYYKNLVYYPKKSIETKRKNEIGSFLVVASMPLLLFILFTWFPFSNSEPKTNEHNSQLEVIEFNRKYQFDTKKEFDQANIFIQECLLADTLEEKMLFVLKHVKEESQPNLFKYLRHENSDTIKNATIGTTKIYKNDVATVYSLIKFIDGEFLIIEHSSDEKIKNIYGKGWLEVPQDSFDNLVGKISEQLNKS